MGVVPRTADVRVIYLVRLMTVILTGPNIFRRLIHFEVSGTDMYT